MSKSMAERAREAREKREARSSNGFQVDNVEKLIVANDESIVKVVNASGGGSGEDIGITRLTALINQDDITPEEFLEEAKKSIMAYIKTYGNKYYKKVDTIVVTDYEDFIIKIVDEVTSINRAVEEMLKDKDSRFNIEAEIARFVATNKTLCQVVSRTTIGA